MKTLFASFLVLLVVISEAAVPTQNYTDFYISNSTSGATNVNSGSTDSGTPTFSATSGNWTNDTSASTGTFFKSGIDLASVSVGMWASVYLDPQTATGFLGRITAVDDTADTITVATTTASGGVAGNKPATSVGGASIRVGGCWYGPVQLEGNGASYPTNTFPFNLVVGTMTNGPAYMPCVNFLTGTYNITNALTLSQNGPVRFSAYTTTPRDGVGVATIDGGTTYPYYVLLTVTGTYSDWNGFTFTHNGASGTPANGVTVSGAGTRLNRCVFHDLRKSGVSGAAMASDCTAYACNQANSSNAGALDSLAVAVNCVARDNPGSAVDGFYGGTIYIGCTSTNNGRAGIVLVTSSAACVVRDCNLNANGGAGLELKSTSFSEVMNCNIVKNGGAGITNTTVVYNKVGRIIGCGFGTGTQTNTYGSVSPAVGGMFISGCVEYAADQTPWITPANGETVSTNVTATASGSYSFVQ